MFAPSIVEYFGLIPQAGASSAAGSGSSATYMFLHAGAMHILFNMLGVWMFGVELERRWGTQLLLRLLRRHAASAAALTFLLSRCCRSRRRRRPTTPVTIGASGALFGLLLAFAIYYPERPILMLLVFPVPAQVFVMIFGGDCAAELVPAEPRRRRCRAPRRH